MKIKLIFLILVVFNSNSFAKMRAGIFIGVNEGNFMEDPLFYAEKDAIKMYEIFINYGEVENKLSFLLKGKEIEEIKEKISELRERIELAKKIEDVEIECIFYYSGHAGEDGLHIKGKVFPYREVYENLKNLNCNLLIGIFDACNSGKFLRIKGFKYSKEEFRINLFDIKNGEIFITSSAENEFSQEKDEFRGSIFTYYLVTALGGEADIDGDERVSLSEAYNYAYEKTIIETFGSSKGLQIPSFKYELKGAQEVILTILNQSKKVVFLPENIYGILTIMDRDRGIIIGDFKVKQKNRKLFIPEGNYLVRLKTENGKLYLASLKINEKANFSKFESIEKHSDPFKGKRDLHHIRIKITGGFEASNDKPIIRKMNYGGRFSFTLDNIFIPPVYAGLVFGAFYGKGTETQLQTEVRKSSKIYEFGILFGLMKRFTRLFEISGDVNIGFGYGILEKRFDIFKSEQNGFFFLSGIGISAIWHISRDIGIIFPNLNLSIFGYKKGESLFYNLSTGASLGLCLTI